MQRRAGLGWGSLAVWGELLASRAVWPGAQGCRLFFPIPHMGMFPGAPSLRPEGVL